MLAGMERRSERRGRQWKPSWSIGAKWPSGTPITRPMIMLKRKLKPKLKLMLKPQLKLSLKPSQAKVRQFKAESS